MAWEQAYQLSMVGASFVFAYIASTINFDEKFNNGIKILLYMFAMAMLLISIGSNYAIINSNNPLLINTSVGATENIGFALRGGFFTVLGILLVLFFILLILSFVAVVNIIKQKKERRQNGEPY